MRKYLSLFSCIFICIIYLFVRLEYSDLGKRPNLKTTDWDALGYYMYLPGIVIYHDVTTLEWFSSIDEEYHVSGGELYQALQQDNGNYYVKYLGGVAVMQSPFFLAAHLYAKNSSHYKADGFSPPYQYAIVF